MTDQRRRAFAAWAIHLGYPDSKGLPLAGVYWFHKRLHGSLMPWHDGCRTALFSTRAAARQHKKDKEITRGRVIKVAVSISEVR